MNATTHTIHRSLRARSQSSVGPTSATACLHAFAISYTVSGGMWLLPALFVMVLIPVLDWLAGEDFTIRPPTARSPPAYSIWPAWFRVVNCCLPGVPSVFDPAGR